MEKKKYIKFIKNKREMGKIIIYLLIAIMLFFSMRTIAATILAGSESVIADEKTIVRTAAAVSKGASSSNIVEIASLTTELGRYASTTVTSLSSERIQVEFEKTGNIYEIDVNHGPIFDIVNESVPYLPLGYTPVANTDLEDGFVIQDESGNQFVWVEVPRTEAVYPTAGLDIKNFTSEEFEKIEADLNTYTATYRPGTYSETWSSEASTGLTSEEYSELKKKMLKSIYKNGGFYVGRYETGIDYSESARTASGDTTQTPVIKQNAYPYNFVTRAQAQELSESFKTTGYETNLMFGVQWDLILKYLETSGAATQAELITNSTSWGGYKDAIYTITNTNAKYNQYNSSYSGWKAAPYENTGTRIIMLSTGAIETFGKQNIYDLAGNVWEYTFQNTGVSGTESVGRGGNFYDSGITYPANFEMGLSNTFSHWNSGFRVCLYKDEGTYVPDETNQPTYIPDGYTAIDGTMDTGFVVADQVGNEYVWVEVPQTVAVYQTAGLSITAFTEEEFDQIEEDLKTYTSVYDVSGYSDDWTSETITGMTEVEYNTQKKKMLKSIYVNGGFYVGRYETGTATVRTTSSEALGTAVIKPNMYPYNYVWQSSAVEVASSFATNGYISNLLYGLQWNLILKYLEVSEATTQAQLSSDSRSWGNTLDSTFTITNIQAGYKVTAEGTGQGTWVSGAYGTKASGASVAMTTGASDDFKKQNIYDLAGNVWTRTLESSNTLMLLRGGSYNDSGTDYPASGFWECSPTSGGSTIGFRVCLYKDEGTSTYDAPTYIPYGYAHVAGTDMETGFVIEDELGNQYVWVEVPKTASVYQTAGTGIALFTDSEFEAIETDLQTYTSTYRASGYTDTWTSIDATGLTESEYNIQKKKVLKSIYKNGGFYVGRYENGIDYSDGARTSATDAIKTSVIKQNAYPYNFVTKAQAQELASSFETTGYETSLMFDVQWDLIMKYLEVSEAATQTELITDSTGWGNYLDSTYNITNTSAKYNIRNTSTLEDTGWLGAPHNKTSASNVILTTGANDRFSKQNIYDLAGNVHEATLGQYSFRGASCGNTHPANYRQMLGDAGYNARDIGFRVSLYKDEGIGITAAYIPEGYTQVSGTNVDNGQVVQDASGNEYVWVKVPRTVTVYPTAGLNIENFTDAEYAAIEEDLQTYTAAYRSQGNIGTDTFYSEAAQGLAESEYYALKKNMLKSVYINGGFYVGRYETGTTTARTSENSSLTTPVIKQNVYPYNYVSVAQSQTLSESFSTEGYQTSLMFGMQWDLVLKYMETSGTSQSDLITDSTNWGNFLNNQWSTTNTSSKYYYASTWTNGTYTKTSDTGIFLTTGASEAFCKQNIYDYAGNYGEWTLESSSRYHGGFAQVAGNVQPANHRNSAYEQPDAHFHIGFRTSLFKEEGAS